MTHSMYLIQLQEVGHAEQEKHVGGSEAGQERVVVVAGGSEGAVSVDCWVHPCLDTTLPAKPPGL